MCTHISTEAALECQNAAMASNDFIQKEIQKEQVCCCDIFHTWLIPALLLTDNNISYSVGLENKVAQYGS